MPSHSSLEILEDGLTGLPSLFPLSPGTPERLAAFAELVAAWSRRMNLSAHRSPAEIADRLILDALALSTVLPAAATIADVGSGAGLPGIPLALVRPEAALTLVEARERRHHFQLHAVRELGLENVEPLLGRAERLPPRPHELVVSQALARPERALPWMQPWARPGGQLALALAFPPPRVPPLPGVEPLEVRRYCPPRGGRERALWLGRRAAPSS